MTLDQKIKKLIDVMQDGKIDERIAIALEGIHKELKRLNDTNPTTKAQPKKNDNKKNLEPDSRKFI